jgi:hypothetical protein
MDRWNEDLMIEDNLEKELEEFREYEEDEQREFEHNIYYNSGISDIISNDFICAKSPHEGYQDIRNGIDMSNISLKIGGYKPIKHDGDVDFCFDFYNSMNFITDIYLEIKMPESFLDLTEKQKYVLLDTLITLNISKKQINRSYMLSCIFNQICSGRNIKQHNNIIQIPIFNFDTFKTKINKGFPTRQCKSVHSVFLTIKIYEYEYLKNLNFSLIVNGIVVDSYMKKQDMNNKFLVLSSEHDHWEVSKRYYDTEELFSAKYEIYFNCIDFVAKCILFYYIPDLHDDAPEIHSIKLLSDNKEIISYDVNELLNFEIFDIKIYCVPLCKEFSNFEQIHKLFQNNCKNISSNGIIFSKLGKKIEMQINFDKLSQGGHNIIFCAIGFKEYIIDKEIRIYDI